MGISLNVSMFYLSICLSICLSIYVHIAIYVHIDVQWCTHIFLVFALVIIIIYIYIYIYTNMSNVSLKLDHRNHVHGEVDSWNGGLRLQAPNPRVKRSLENSPCMPCFFRKAEVFARSFCGRFGHQVTHAEGFVLFPGADRGPVWEVYLILRQWNTDSWEILLKKWFNGFHPWNIVI